MRFNFNPIIARRQTTGRRAGFKIVASLLASVGACFMLPGCASVFSGTTDIISINSSVQGAEVSIDGNVVGVTPWAGSIRKGRRAKVVMISKPGYQTQQLVLHTELDPLAIVSVVFWDLGTTDFLSGAAWEYSPKSYYANLLSEKATSQSVRELSIKQYAMVNREKLSSGAGAGAQALYNRYFKDSLSFAQFSAKISMISGESATPVEFGEKVWSWRQGMDS